MAKKRIKKKAKVAKKISKKATKKNKAKRAIAKKTKAKKEVAAKPSKSPEEEKKRDKTLITKEMNIGYIVQKYPYPELFQIFMNYGLHCVGCRIGSYESLEDGAKAHGLSDEDIDKMLTEINIITRRKKSEETDNMNESEKLNQSYTQTISEDEQKKEETNKQQEKQEEQRVEQLVKPAEQKEEEVKEEKASFWKKVKKKLLKK